MPSLYQCPLMLHTNGLDDVVVDKLKHGCSPCRPDRVEAGGLTALRTRSKTCTIALVGKYVKLHDAYLSVMRKRCYHAGFENDSQVEIRWVESEDLTDQAACKEAFADVDGIIVPGGFGDRGIEGMIQAAQYARENNVPYFRHLPGDADHGDGVCPPCAGLCRRQFQRVHPRWCQHNVIALMADQKGNIPKGGTMRLGKYPCKVLPGTKMAAAATARARSGSATVTAMSSTTTSGRRCRPRVWSFPAPARTAAWWRPWSCPAVTSIWVLSSTPSSRAVPTARIPCSRHSLPQPSSSALRSSAA